MHVYFCISMVLRLKKLNQTCRPDNHKIFGTTDYQISNILKGELVSNPSIMDVVPLPSPNLTDVILLGAIWRLWYNLSGVRDDHSIEEKCISANVSINSTVNFPGIFPRWRDLLHITMRQGEYQFLSRGESKVFPWCCIKTSSCMYICVYKCEHGKRCEPFSTLVILFALKNFVPTRKKNIVRHPSELRVLRSKFKTILRNLYKNDSWDISLLIFTFSVSFCRTFWRFFNTR